MTLLTKQEFLDKVFNINSSYKERFSYDEFEYKGSRIKSKIKCNSCNNYFEILPWNHLRAAQLEKEKNIVSSGGCKICYQKARKTSRYLNNNNNFPENYNEIDWKAVTYKGEKYLHYLINNKGEVWSKLSNKFIKPSVNPSGYLYHTLYTENKKKNKKVRTHIMVAECFVNNPNPEKFNIVNHKDGNRENPLYSNLEWTNRSGNTKHAHKNPQNYKEIKEVLLNSVETDNEYWIEMLPDFPDYFVSNFGNVKSKKGKKERQLRKNNSSSGHDHLSVALRAKDGKYCRMQVHKLVLKYHLNVPYNTDKMIIDHIDNNKQNNYIGNLEWVNNKINTQRAMLDNLWIREKETNKVRNIDIQRNKYRVVMNISTGVRNQVFCLTKEEAIQAKKELLAKMIITNCVKYYVKKNEQKYYKLFTKKNKTFDKIDDEIKLLEQYYENRLVKK